MKKLAVVPFLALIFFACTDTGPTQPSIISSFRWNMSNNNSATLTVPPGLFDAFYLNNETTLAGLTSTSKFDVRFFGPQVPGDYPASRFVLFTNNTYFVQTAPFNMVVTITNYGGPGQYIIGSFSGTVRDSTSSATFPVNGDFRIRN